MKVLLTLACILICPPLSGQTTASPDSAATARILTDPDGADVYVDSVYVGKSPLNVVALTYGVHLIRVFYPSVFAWNAASAQDSLVVAGSGVQEKHITFGGMLRIQSDPPGGTVLRGGETLGLTPLCTRLPLTSPEDFTILKNGYDSLWVPASKISHGLLKVRLLQRNAGAARPPDVLGVNGRIQKDHLLTYASGAAMIVSGVASAILKDRANRRFDSYLQTNNPSDLSATRGFDRGAAAALIASQVSFAFLAYFLLSE